MGTTAVSLSRAVVRVLLACLLLVPLAQASNASQRQLFIEADEALGKGDLAQFHALRKQLDDYPLAPYLDLHELQRRLDSAAHHDVETFLARHAGTPVADILRRDWLDRLAKRGRWKSYLAFYTPQASVRRQCHRLHALIATGRQAEAWPEVEKVWLHGESRPKACDPAFAAWEEAGQLNTGLSWQRIELAMEAGQWRLARYLGKKLDADDATWLQRWIRMHRNADAVLRHEEYAEAHAYREKMLAHAVRRMARFDGMQALDLWEAIAQRYPFTDTQRYQVERRIALALERNPDARAYALVLGITPDTDDSRLFLARLRAALLRGDWGQIAADLPDWPAGERDSERWRYWQARALEAKGSMEASRQLFASLAQERSYYGFLAADRIDAPYNLAHSDTPASQARLDAMGRQPGIRRALELHALERDTEARREWRYATREADKQDLKAAALLAEQADWHDQAIFTLARTAYWDDLELRFPLRHQQLVEAQAQQHQLDTSWIFAVIRQESAFKRDARSHAGAMGLMQLMPSTARYVAKRYLKQKPPSQHALLEADTNIELGSAYLRQLLDRLEDSPVLATAAYNAGPHRVNKWLPAQDLDADIWVDLVPFNETRRYIRSVMYYTVIYEKRLGLEPKRLSERMGPIGAAASKIAGA
jgi:soluble lytic murein transglycosylase